MLTSGVFIFERILQNIYFFLIPMLLQRFAWYGTLAPTRNCCQDLQLQNLIRSSIPTNKHTKSRTTFRNMYLESGSILISAQSQAQTVPKQFTAQTPNPNSHLAHRVNNTISTTDHSVISTLIYV